MASNPPVAPVGNVVLPSATFNPPTPDITVDIAPLALAGLELAKIVLALTAASIVILTAILAWAEARGAARHQSAYSQGLAIATGMRSSRGDARLELLSAQLGRARSDPAWVMTPAEATDAAAGIKALAGDPTTSVSEREALATCVPPPPAAAADRDQVLERCISVLNQKLSSQQAMVERVKLIQELQKQADEARQAFRTFWLQVAQLILMNLFFPLLTALLGYIFGTQQQSQRS